MQSSLGSLVDARRLAPLVMFVTGVVTIAEGAAQGGELGLACLFGLGVPTLGTTAVAWMLARGRTGGAFAAVLGWMIAHAVLSLALGGVMNEKSVEMMLFVALLPSGITFVLALPGWIVGAVLAHQKELDAGDTLLGCSAVWFGLLQVFYLTVFGSKGSYGMVTIWLVLVACVATLLVVISRGVARRRWVARAVRGHANGWRVREASVDERIALPPLVALHVERCGVLERVRVGESAASPYRGDLIGEPFALVPLA